MDQAEVSAHLSRKMTEMAVACGKRFQGYPEDVAAIAAFVEAEMKGQELPGAARDRDTFVAATFERLYPKMLASETCRQAVQNMIAADGGENPFSHHDSNPQYRINTELADALYLSGSALMGSILMVTAGESGGSIAQREH
ncbi:hypothetical protein [Desmospora activa]|uniref:Uncharacterized protein n=1 Tax=Desmospora activa DSM 45169 TaxID=1121389 RepID=A0A2T4Z0N6_9BACL|nr:hypothetical protein [Desmospora activa]PTM53270.1 hypothetical protein C8J48_3594 [Desmospora activa DSM 45169]